jgi:hypothetical protein
MQLYEEDHGQRIRWLEDRISWDVHAIRQWCCCKDAEVCKTSRAISWSKDLIIRIMVCWGMQAQYVLHGWLHVSRSSGRHGLKMWIIMALMVERYGIGMFKHDIYVLVKVYDHRNAGLMGNATRC